MARSAAFACCMWKKIIGISFFSLFAMIYSISIACWGYQNNSNQQQALIIAQTAISLSISRASRNRMMFIPIARWCVVLIMNYSLMRGFRTLFLVITSFISIAWIIGGIHVQGVISMILWIDVHYASKCISNLKSYLESISWIPK